MKTWNAKKEDYDNNRAWYVIDADGKSVGRLASQVAQVLTGKSKPTFTPHVDTGDMVVIINADKVTLSGNKWLSKKYYRRSRFFGSLKETTAKEMLEKNPTFILQDAVSGMLPKTRLGKQMITKLKIYAGGEHPHQAQNPQVLQ
ncbi:MAG: 50S ribosomal protein L13 [Bdellovibrionales bacterium]|nr:50S ribosomal protein L13 [Bdellovibrionales bacterium]NQZ19881.1 50S ribosomal protein L13 [Bdellovibrionales bacterium]